MGKVGVFADADLTAASPGKRGARVTVALCDGERYERLVEYPKGEPENAMTDADLEAKAVGLIKCAGFSDARTKEITAAVWATRSINDLKLMCCKE